jgi:hypothetical protein
MPPVGPRSIVKLTSKPTNIKETIRELAFYYRNYKKMFIVAVILSLIAGITATSAILLNGYIYSEFIIPSTVISGSHNPSSGIPQIDYGVFGLISFIWFCISLLIVYLVSNGLN